MQMKSKDITKMANAYKLYLLTESGSGLPPGFDFGDEVNDLSEIPLTPGAKKVLATADDNPENLEEDDREDELQRHGQDFDLDKVGKAKTNNDDKWAGVDDVQFASLKKGSKKYDEIVKQMRRSTHRGVDVTEIEAELNQQIKDAKKRAKGNDTDDKKLASAERLSRLVHNSTFLDIIDSSGNTIDEEEFKKVINVIPDKLIAQNDKIKKSGGDSMAFYELTMPAYQGLFYNQNKGTFQMVRTCPNAGDCKTYCYATAGSYIQYKGVNLKQMRMLNYLMNDWAKFKNQIIRELKRAGKENKGKQVVLRWHDSGDFFAEAYLDIALEIAAVIPQVTHYAYTKNVNLISKKLKNSQMPDNFVFNLSEGGTLDDKLKHADKKSLVLPKEVFKPYFTKTTGKTKGRYDEQGLKDATVKYFGTRTDKKPLIIDHELLTYKEMMERPKDQKGKFSVIVTTEDGDDSATDPRVINTILLLH
jgi:hypothetical protein